MSSAGCDLAGDVGGHRAAGLADPAGAGAACRRVGRDGDSVAAVAREFRVGWGAIMAAVGDHGQPLVDDPSRFDGVESVGVDETALAPRLPRRPPDSSPALSI
ncbi:MAG TPA: hypothetical protein VF734_19300 [Pseudonocardiaceae bacterium]